MIRTMRRILRKSSTAIFGGLVVAIISGVGGEFFVELARERGWYSNPSQRLDAAITTFREFATQPWLIYLALSSGGLTFGLWVDRMLRRREEMKLEFYDPDLFTYDPRDKVEDRNAYYDLMAFALEYLLPACDRQIELQKAIIRHLASNEKIAVFATDGLEADRGVASGGFFWPHYNNIVHGIDSSEATIKFDALINCIKGLKADGYRKFCSQALDISGGVAPDKNPTLHPLWESWRIAHNKLVREYEKVRKDVRFGKLFRPRRDSRWGGTIEPPDVFG